MVLSDKKTTILTAAAEHYVFTAAQARGFIFQPQQDKEGRQTRRLLAELVSTKFLQKTNCEVVNPLYGLTCPVYFPSRLGAETLAMQTGDPRWLHTPTQTPNWQNLAHWVALTDLRIRVRAAIGLQKTVTMPAWYNEFDTIADAADPAKRYRLYTVVTENPRRIVCIPDAAFLLQMGGFARAFYIELERGTNPIEKAAAEKTPGYAHLGELHKRHFSTANAGFGVLMFAPNPKWRDALCKAIARKDGAALWSFASVTEVKPESFLFAPIFHKCDGSVVALLKGGKK